MARKPRSNPDALVPGWNRVAIPKRVMDRAYSKTVTAVTGCWISTYSTGSHGYAQVGWKNSGERHMVLAHRAVWERFNGRVPVGMSLDHLCRERRCVNPAHLRLLENFENARRTSGANWELGQCANGHPNSMLEIQHERRAKSGVRRDRLRCRECKRIYFGRYNWKSRRPGEPLPDHLLLASERRDLGEAA